MPQDGDQQTHLRDAMRILNLTRDAFAARLGVGRRALDTWLLPAGSPEFRTMPEVVGRFVSEIVAAAPRPVAAGEPLIRFEGKPQLLTVDQLNRESVEALFRVADLMEPIAKRRKVTRVLEGAVLGSLFFEASTRTRVSFSAAFCRLGGAVCSTTGLPSRRWSRGNRFPTPAG